MKFERVSTLLGVAAIATLLGLGGCGGGGSDFAAPSFSAGGTLTGLAAGQSLDLADGNGASVTLSQDGTYQFSGALQFNAHYAVTVSRQPTGQVCTVANGTGAGVAANVSGINVSCSATTFSIGGTVAGLADGATVVLSSNGANTASIAANGAFVFGAPVNYNGAYAVTVASQPTGQVCTVGNGNGVGVTGNVSNVAVTCQAQTFAVSGSVNGLQAGTQLTLMNNGADPQVVTANGAFAFTGPVAYGSAYAVVVNQQPAGQTCSIAQGTGSNVVAAVSDVVVSCALNGYSVGGMVSGLASGAQLTLFDNGGDALVLDTNGSFTFSTPVVPAGSYAVTINQQPAGQVCAVSSGSGTASANVATIAVTCASAYTVGGTVTGLPSGTQLTLSNNGSDAVVVSVDGAFSFANPLAAGAGYAVTITSQPSGATCVANNPTGTMGSANVGNVAVVCITPAQMLPLLKFTQNQVGDARWNLTACTTTDTCVVSQTTPGVTYVTPYTNGRFDWAACGAGAQMIFEMNMVNGVQDPTNPYTQKLYNAGGTLCQSGGTGHFVIAGRDAQSKVYLFYVGSDNNTGTMISTQVQLTGAGVTFTGTSRPDIYQLFEYLSGH